jgi:hypothetical protein
MSSLHAARAAAALRRLAADEAVDEFDREALRGSRDLLQSVVDALPFDPTESVERGRASRLRRVVSTEVIAVAAAPEGVDKDLEDLAKYLRGVIYALEPLGNGADPVEEQGTPSLVDLRDFFERLSEGLLRQASLPPETVVR